MSRAADITLFIIILESSIGFVSATGLFTQDYVSTTSADQVRVYNVTNLNTFSHNLTAESQPGITDIVSVSLFWLWEAFVIVVSIVLSIAIAWIPLVYTFHVPAILATFLQGGIYYCYALFYAQWKSGKGIKLYDY
jgi:hypothetical protein